MATRSTGTNGSLPKAGESVLPLAECKPEVCKHGCPHILRVPSMHTKSLQSCPTLCNPMDCSSPGSSVHGDSAGKNTGVGCYFLFQAIFPTQELNLHLLSPALAGRFFTTDVTWEFPSGGLWYHLSLAVLQRSGNQLGGHSGISRSIHRGV